MRDRLTEAVQLHRLGIRPAPPDRDERASATGAVTTALPSLPSWRRAPCSMPAVDRAPLRLAWPALRGHPRDPLALGGTVNDVVLAILSGALGRYLHARGLPTEGVELRAMCPVSMRRPDERGALGNLVSIMIAPLYVGIADPVARLDGRAPGHGTAQERGSGGRALFAAAAHERRPRRVAGARGRGHHPPDPVQHGLHRRAGTADPALSGWAPPAELDSARDLLHRRRPVRRHPEL